MARSTAASSPREADGGLESLLRLEEELAEALEIARAQAREVVDEARREADALRRRRREELETEVAALQAEAREEMQRRLADLAADRETILELYRVAAEDRLEELADWTVRRLLAELEEAPP